MLEPWALPRSQEPVGRPLLLHLHSWTTRTHLAGGASRMPKWHLPIFPSGREMQSHNSSASPLNKKDSPVHSGQEENPERSLWDRLSCKTAKTDRKAGRSHVQGRYSDFCELREKTHNNGAWEETVSLGRARPLWVPEHCKVCTCSSVSKPGSGTDSNFNYAYPPFFRHWAHRRLPNEQWFTTKRNHITSFRNIYAIIRAMIEGNWGLGSERQFA